MTVADEGFMVRILGQVIMVPVVKRADALRSLVTYAIILRLDPFCGGI